MAEKSFGVKEINLIGASGTPTIESPNNLNLNAVNVAISTNVTIGGTLTVSGNVSVGGTLTYEDVTNIDSIGVITARSGVDVDDFISVGSNIHLGNAGIITATSFSGPATQITVTDESSDTMTFPVFVTASVSGGLIQTANLAPQAGSNLYFNSSTGQLTASSFNASGQTSNLSLSNTSVQVSYVVTANGSSAYRFAGNGVVSTADNPDLYLIRGQKYRFVNNSGGSHPFQIREASGGTAYSTGVTNNGAASGNIDFAPTFDSPAQLVYQCTVHGGMVGNIYLRGAAGNNTNVGVTTFTGIINSTAQAGFYARMQNTKSNVMGGGASYYTVPFDTDSGSICYDTHNSYNTSNGLYTVPTGGTGYYMLATAICLSSNVYGRGGEFWFIQGSNRYFFDRRYFPSTTGTITGFYGTSIIYLSAGQSIGVQGFISGGSTDVDVQGASATDQITWFTARKIA